MEKVYNVTSASFLLQAHFAMIVILSYVITTRKKTGERTSFFTRSLEFLCTVIQIFRASSSRLRNRLLLILP